ncbi:MAG: efflux RND transporter periplasmic adaptor subunit [Anaerolineae bacterium]|nr:efflux RND transporter periplasmic adaptor subunit [Anaerolineae bacterium]
MLKIHHHAQKRFTTSIFVVRLSLMLLVLTLTACATAKPQPEPEAEPLAGTGTLEGREVTIASELGGRIVALTVNEGDTVNAGEVLVRLDEQETLTQIAQAEAAVGAAEANVARLKAGARPEELSATEAALQLAQAQSQSAATTLLYARETLSNPTELNLEIAQAKMKFDLAELAIEDAKVQLDAEQLNYHIYIDLKDNVSDSTRRMWDLRIQAANATITKAEAERDAVRADLYALYDLRKMPLETSAQLHGAEAAYTATLAAVAAAQAKLDKLREGTHPEEIAAAEALVTQARAGLLMALTQQTMLTLTAPISGIVTARSYYTGELVPAGYPIISLANLDTIHLTLYVPESRIGEVYTGQKVDVIAESFPGEVFTGTVERISTEAEYTPGSVETSGDRARRVFAVRIAILNLDYRLFPGAPATGTFQP